MIFDNWSGGVMEYRSIGVLEYWSVGVLECWSIGVLNEDHTLKFINELLL
jgi:hypothetical protein